MKKRKTEKEAIDPRICDHEVIYVEVLSQPDKTGRQEYLLYWWGYHPSTDEYGWRGQIFYGNLNERIGEMENYGEKICKLN
jgi:hypothetical protein